MVVLALPLAGAAVAWVLMARIQPPPRSNQDSLERTLITAPIQRRVLRSHVVARGSVREIGRTEVNLAGDVGNLEGEPIYTGGLVAPGELLTSGTVLAEISGRPVMVIEGAVPMYRTLLVGSRGEDVRQLESYLAWAGFLGAGIDDLYDESTAGAVETFYRARGYEPVRAAVVDHVGATGIGRGERPPGSGHALVPRGELTFVSDLPRTVDASNARVGQAPSGVAFALRGVRVEVRAEVARRWMPVIGRGTRAELVGPEVGLQAVARVVDVVLRRSQVDQVMVRMVSAKRLRPWVRANVAVHFSFAVTEDRVLVAPVAALHTDEVGSTYVEVVRGGTSGDERISRVGVDLGLAADALVEVEPVSGELHAGDRVVVSVQ
ncbi:peptidoglycan-binding domain-containing protein [Nocardioides stalactiti]|uniref:peptidoglycan-binding domain-containing protein n=1 Tax=Nocardioides stalactiti TaxID=2755356 RepID=UPI0016027420|nr:peptidoglycan-binding domain-containing protein [Nocardioides stalactiti]